MPWPLSLSLSMCVCVCVCARAFSSPTPSITDVLPEDALLLVARKVKPEDWFVLAVQCRAMYTALLTVYEETVPRWGRHLPVRWRTSAACSESRFLWATRRFLPRLFVPNRTALERMAYEGLHTLCRSVSGEHKIELSDSVYRNAGASGREETVLDFWNSASYAARIQIMIGATEFDRLDLFHTVFAYAYDPYIIHNIILKSARAGSVRVMEHLLDGCEEKEGIDTVTMRLLLTECVRHSRSEALKVLYRRFPSKMQPGGEQYLCLTSLLKFDCLPRAGSEEKDKDWLYPAKDSKPGNPVEVMRVMLEDMGFPFYEEVADRAVESGLEEAVEYVHSRHFPVQNWHCFTWSKVFTCAHLKGSLHMAECVHRLHSSVPDPDVVSVEVMYRLLDQAASMVDTGTVDTNRERQERVEKVCISALKWLRGKGITCRPLHISLAIDFGSVLTADWILCTERELQEQLPTSPALLSAVGILAPGKMRYGLDRHRRFFAMVDYLLGKGAVWTPPCLRTAALHLDGAFSSPDRYVHVLKRMCRKGATYSADELDAVHPDLHAQMLL